MQLFLRLNVVETFIFLQNVLNSAVNKCLYFCINFLDLSFSTDVFVGRGQCLHIRQVACRRCLHHFLRQSSCYIGGQSCSCRLKEWHRGCDRLDLPHDTSPLPINSSMAWCSRHWGVRRPTRRSQTAYMSLLIWHGKSSHWPLWLSNRPILKGVGLTLLRTVQPVSLLLDVIATNPETGAWCLIKLSQELFPNVVMFGSWVWDGQVCSWLGTSAICFVPIHLVLYNKVTWLVVSVPIRRADFSQKTPTTKAQKKANNLNNIHHVIKYDSDCNVWISRLSLKSNQTE